MAKREHLSMRKPAPAWLNDIVPNAAHRHWGHQLAVALDLEVDGQGASTGFELTAFAMGRHGAAIGIKELIDAALVPAAMAAAARASITYPLLGKPGDLPPDSTTLVLERLDSRLRRCDATFPGATAVFSILLRNAIRGKHHIGRATVQRMASMAGACLADGKPADRERWRALARLQPLDLRSLEEFIKLHGEGEPVTLARTLHKALANKKPSPLPLETANQPGSGKDNTPPLPFAPGTAPGQPTKKTVVLTGPSWAALHSAASYAGMAEGVVLYPHFQRQVVPGWLDRPLRWRHLATAALDNVVLLSPRPEWVATLPDGKQHTVDGFLTVDDKKVTDLPADVVMDLHKSGILGLIHLHWVSMGNMRRLVDWHVERAAAGAPAAAAAPAA